MKGMQKKCEKLEKNTKKLEQELVLLRSHIEMKMIEHSQVEQYKQEIEERVPASSASVMQSQCLTETKKSCLGSQESKFQETP